MRRRTFWDGWLQDARYGLRALGHHRGFASVAVLSLALGIGTTTTIFTFVDAVLLRPLPYPGADRIVVLREQPLTSASSVNVHPLNFIEWRARARAFEALALVQTPPLNVVGANGAEQIARVQTTPDLFRVFGLEPTLGRAFTEQETRQARSTVVILGHRFWQRWFGGDPTVLGRTLDVQDGALTIVGVAPAGLRIGTAEPDAYTPLSIDPANPGAIGSRSFQCYGRLRPGTTVTAAKAEMAAIATTLATEYPLDAGMGVFVAGLQDYLTRDERPALRLLMAVAITVLVIACVNIAGLLLARGMSRRGELAVRAALGASRGRIVRQLIVESVVLSLAGAIAGIVLAYWATQGLVGLTAGALNVGANAAVGLDRTAVAFALGVSAITALGFGLIPAWQGSRVDPQVTLKLQARGSTADRGHHRLRTLLVVAEVAIAVVLLVGAALLLRTLSAMVRVDLGFQSAETITTGLFLGDKPPEARVAIVDQMLDRIEMLPGVRAAGTIQFLPLSGMNCGTGFWFEGRLTEDPSRAPSTDCSLVSRGYFAAMGISVLEGRPFDRSDRIGSPRVLVVNQSFARRYFPQQAAVGRRIRVIASNQEFATIVGVVGDVLHNGLTTEPAPTVFLLHEQTPGYVTNLVVRTTGMNGAQASHIRQAIHDVDPTQAVSGFSSMDRYLGDALVRPRLYAVLVTCFASLAVGLAAMGVYGLVAYAVTQRTREFGIRLALGATPGGVFLAVVRQGAWLLSVGLVIGVAVAFGLRGVLSTFLFGVTSSDPVSYLVAALAFAAVTGVVVAIPARRASLVDPNRALRCE